MRKLFLLFALSFGVIYAQNTMNLTFDTEVVVGTDDDGDIISEGTTIALPLRGDVNVIVDWGDGSLPETITTEGYHQHTYDTDGQYDVTISGSLSWFGTLSTPNASMDEIEQSYAEKLIAVTSFGDLGIESLEGAFAKCTNLVVVPTELPGSVTSLRRIFYNARKFNQNINTWDVANVTDMYCTFESAVVFNQPLNNWNVSNVTNMHGMFQAANAFNNDVTNWDVSNVTAMGLMFAHCFVFNQDISSWEVDNVENMRYMFYNNYVFNQDISNWNVGNVENMRYMFYGAKTFNQDIGGWNVSNVTDMSYMFREAFVFSHDISDWEVDKVENMEHMFFKADGFNHNIGKWNVGAVTNMQYMFYNNKTFNKSLNNWDVSKVENMSHMFRGASAFNGDISDWEVSKVTNMYGMFAYATNFNQDISNWNVNNVTNMENIFTFTDKFNQPIGKWNVSNVTNMKGMFMTAKAFDQDISSWNVSNVTNMNSMFRDAINFSYDISNWIVDNVEDMGHMFFRANSFNYDISKWNVGAVTNMEYMFYLNDTFNQDIGNWDVSNVTKMYNMFAHAAAFDQDLGDWNVSNVSDMRSMFAATKISTYNYNSLLENWSNLTLQNGVTFNGGSSKYSAGNPANARENIQSDFNWSIADGGISQLPSVGIYSISDVTTTTASIVDEVNYSGASDITERGIIWSRNSMPTKINNEGLIYYNDDLGRNTTILSDLESFTTYYVRAFAINEEGTEYSSQKVFITKAPLTLSGTFTVADKDYDGTNDATITACNILLDGVLAEHDVEIESVKVRFVQDDIGEDIEVEIYEIILSGKDADKYLLSLDGAPTTTADISPGISVGVINKIEELFSVYPNPFTDMLIFSGIEDDCNIIVTDLVGQTIINTKLSDGKTLDVSALTKGVYIVKVVSQNGKTKVLKMIKQ